MTITTFRRLAVTGWYDWDDNQVDGFIYLPENRDIPTAPDFIDNWLHIRENDNGDKKYYMPLDRGEYESDQLKDLENILFDWAEGEYHQGTYKIEEIAQLNKKLEVNKEIDQIKKIYKDIERQRSQIKDIGEILTLSKKDYDDQLKKISALRKKYSELSIVSKKQVK